MWPRLGRRGRRVGVRPAFTPDILPCGHGGRRGRRRADREALAVGVPSMWPRLGRRGRRGFTAGATAQRRFLQCGHGLDAVEDRMTEVEWDAMMRLQCGHGLDAVEDESTAAELDALEMPSMWPRLGRRGRRRRPGALGYIKGYYLQCGHGLDAVEDSIIAVVIRRTDSAFNVATAWTPWKTQTPFAAAPIRTDFNVATAWTPWKTGRGSLPRSAPSPTFNVATAWTPWKTRFRRR